MDELERGLIAASYMALGLGGLALGYVLVARAAARRRVGAVLWRENPPSVSRSLRWSFAAAAAAAMALAWEGAGDSLWPSAALVLLTLALLALTPGDGCQVCGERGVARGLDSRRFEELEEWRLTGEHLRWKLHGEWIASRAPVEHHAALRERLAAAAPGRESPFA